MKIIDKPMILLLKIIFKEFYQLIISKNYRQFARLVLLYGSKKRYRQISVKTNNYNLTICDNLSFIWQYKEIFVDEIYRFPSNNDAPLIFDCGSNIGLSCLYFKKIYPHARIKAFEADPKITGILKINLSRNNIKGVEIYDKAVWINDEQINFNRDGADGGAIANSESDSQIQVQAIRLKTLLEKEKHIDMMKMDVEGAETVIVEDVRDLLFKIDNIFIEYHSFNNHAQELEKILLILKENKFRYYIQAVNNRKMPMVKIDTEKIMDFQANIFAYNRHY